MRFLLKSALTLIVILIIAFAAHPQQDRQLTQGGSNSSNAQSNRRIALVIGNGSYANAPPLKNPTNDAGDMADALARLGFTVARGIDLNQRQMKAMIREFGQKLKSGGQGLFYFAGHGVQLRGRNYLIPIDASIQSEADVEDQGVDANLILGLMDEAGNALNVVILDACRNNPFGRSFRSVSSGLAQMDAPSGTLIAYATAPGSVASDGSVRNGLYTQELLKNMAVPGLSIEEVFKRVRVAVRGATAGKQTPWEASSLTGDFFFSGAKSAANTVETKPPISTVPAAQCFARDPAVGSVDRQAHYNWATSRDTKTLEAHLKDKIALLFDCPSMDAERLSSVFGVISVLVAKYVPDANCFGGDAGVVATDLAGHQSWGLSKGAAAMRNNLQWKTVTALNCLSRSQQAAFYADVSVAVASAP
jgi:hypothetical protein